MTTLNSLLGSIGKFLNKSTTPSIVGVDIGSSSVKVVQLKQEKSRIVLETYGEIALGLYEGKTPGELTSLNNEQLSTVLIDVLREANITTKDPYFAIQSNASLVFLLSLPRITERDLGTTIPNEARKYIPVPLSEVSLDWWVLPENLTSPGDEQLTTNNDKMEVFVAAIRNDALKKYQSIIAGAGLSAGSFEMEVFSALRSTLKNDLSPILLVDFGASGVRIAAVEYGVVKKFHTVNRGSYHLSMALAQSLSIPFERAEKLKKEVGLTGTGYNDEVEKAREILQSNIPYLFSEIGSVLQSYEQEYRKAINKIYLVGGGANLAGFREDLEKRFSVPVYNSNAFSRAQAPVFLEKVLEQSSGTFAVAIGCALKQLQS